MDRGAWQARVHRVAKSRIRLNNFHFHFMWFMKILCIILGYTPVVTACLWLASLFLCYWGFSFSPGTRSNSHTADNSHTSTCPGTLSSHPLHSDWVGGECWDYLMNAYIYVKEFMMHLLLLFICSIVSQLFVTPWTAACQVSVFHYLPELAQTLAH